MFRANKEHVPVPHPLLYNYGITKLAPTVLRDYGGLVHANAERLDGIDSGYILAPPHRSWWDIPAVGLCMYRHDKTQVHFMAKHEFWNNKFFGRVLTATGAFPIVRGRADVAPETIAHIGELTRQKAALCIFPEGGIKQDDVQRKDLKRGMAAIAIAYGLPLVPVGIVGIAKEFKDEAPIAVSFGEPIVIQQQDIDFSNPRSIVEPASIVRDQLFSGMQVAQAEARDLQRSV